MTSPKLFGRSQTFFWEMPETVGRCYIFHNDFFWLLPTYLGDVCFLAWLLPKHLGAVIYWRMTDGARIVVFPDYPNLFGRCLFSRLTSPKTFGRSHFLMGNRQCTTMSFTWLLQTKLGAVVCALLLLPIHLGDVRQHLGDVCTMYTCFSQIFLTAPNSYDISQLSCFRPRSPWLSFFSKGQRKIFSMTAPKFWRYSLQFLTAPNIFGSSHIFF